eukprot:TRINITY_DN9712_c0_g1_i1.p1 TRINITY_DN9712_c0_g1~~TRINITY_DN9712_c0_g1_i1.p1  ORF type:complete len:164 (-),score=27.44 TRINITY_DN9712_c0_g1_i1:133-624(-)
MGTGENLVKVFVYGTLKRGEPNHGLLSSAGNGFQKLLGIAKTSKSFPLVIASRYNIPYLLDKEGTGNRVEGELYEVDQQMLARLDVLEDHPKYYTRREETVQLIENANDTPIAAWIYLFPKYKPQLLDYETLTSYSNENLAQDKKYVARKDRTTQDYYGDVMA